MATVRTVSVPETGSDERMHVLDETCWCGPSVVDATSYDDLPDGAEIEVHKPMGAWDAYHCHVLTIDESLNMAAADRDALWLAYCPERDGA